MKIFYRMSFIFMMSITVISCTQETETPASQTEINHTFNMNNRAQEAFNYFAATQAIVNDVDGGYEYEFPLSQTDLDRLKTLTGIEADVDLQGVNSIINDVSTAHAMGYEKYMDEKMNLQKFTKTTVLSIAKDGPLPDVVEDRNFKKLPEVEKSMILAANNIAQSWKDKSRTGGNNGYIDEVFCSVGGGAIGTYAGMAIGGFFGGPLGATIGGWIGGAIGGFLGWVFGSSK